MGGGLAQQPHEGEVSCVQRHTDQCATLQLQSRNSGACGSMGAPGNANTDIVSPSSKLQCAITVTIISSKIKDPYGEDGESERFFCLWSEIQRCGGPSILENRHNGQAKAPSTGGRR